MDIWFLYIMLCENNKLYIGVTNNLKKRIRMHKGEISGGAKYTKANKAIDFVYIEPHICKSICQSREYFLKKMSKKSKIELINSSTFINNSEFMGFRNIGEK